MMTDERVMQIVQSMLGNFNSPPVPTHFHNNWDGNNLDPATALLGFPVFQVADSSVAPTDLTENGKFRYQVDNKGGVPHYWLWSYLVYADQSNGAHTGNGNQVGKWAGYSIGTAAATPTYFTGTASFGGAVFAPTDVGGQSMTVTGAAIGDYVLVSLSEDLQGIIMTGYVTSANTVQVQFYNVVGVTITLAPATISALVIKYP